MPNFKKGNILKLEPKTNAAKEWIQANGSLVEVFKIEEDILVVSLKTNKSTRIAKPEDPSFKVKFSYD